MDAKTDTKVRLNYLHLIVEYFQKNPSSDEALIYLGEKLSDPFRDYRDASVMFSRAFRVKPTAEAAREGFNSQSQYDPEGAAEFLLTANKTLPHNGFVA